MGKGERLEDRNPCFILTVDGGIKGEGSKERGSNSYKEKKVGEGET